MDPRIRIATRHVRAPAAAAGVRARVAALGLALLAGCSPTFTDHGYVPSEADLALVTVGVDTKESVAAVVGRPSSAGILADSGYYYVSSRRRNLGIRQNEIVDREVVAISFDAAGTVANVERFGLERGRVVPISRRVTETNVRGQGFLRQLFGNIGNFNPADFFGGNDA